ncbi:hypothetical protein [Sphingomonas sp.]|jgi:hypothetical protein|uniref:hypothetical protein n=1 Tax=Sphingomonas sp. TaxID=28214 RepID=UPI002D7E1FC1|nr:hypothetical protein [Sphingomonas sp.]HEU0043686.1 hypothetical protein [Sphingomonas sp.]
MIAILLQLSVGALPQQSLPATGCAAYLWTVAEPRHLVAMASAEPASLRVHIDGKPVDLQRTAAEGIAGRGLAATSSYGGGDATVSLELTAVERPDLKDGAVVPDAMLTVARTGKDTVVMPVAGLIGCRPAK